jgi:hypothetical protein
VGITVNYGIKERKEYKLFLNKEIKRGLWWNLHQNKR